jgi:hypothetical protein
MQNIRSQEITGHSAVPVHSGTTPLITPVPPIESLESATARLNSAASLNEAVDAVFETAASLMGAGEAALYTIEWELAMLRLIGSRGIGAHVLVKMGSGRIGEAALHGKEYVAGTGVPAAGQATDDRLTVCLPLIYDDKPAFILAVYGLLPQKKHLHKDDLAVLRFLRDRAAAALLRLHE